MTNAMTPSMNTITTTTKRRRINQSSCSHQNTSIIICYSILVVIALMMIESTLAVKPPVFSFEALEPRIVGGYNAELNRYPYYGFPAGPYNCGATLIWNDILLTAAHCTDAFLQGGILLGGNTIDGKSSTYYAIESATLHPEYSSSTYVNDIAILKIKGNAPGPYAVIDVNPVLPAVDDEITVIGYGNTAEEGPYSTELLQVELSTSDIAACTDYFGEFFNGDIMLCIGGGRNDIGQDACQGDSGGPMFIKGTNDLVGLVSFGDGCARIGVPSINTKVEAHHGWIENTLCTVSAYAPEQCSMIADRLHEVDFLHERTDMTKTTTEESIEHQRTGNKNTGGHGTKTTTTGTDAHHEEVDDHDDHEEKVTVDQHKDTASTTIIVKANTAPKGNKHKNIRIR